MQSCNFGRNRIISDFKGFVLRNQVEYRFEDKLYKFYSLVFTIFGSSPMTYAM